MKDLLLRNWFYLHSNYNSLTSYETAKLKLIYECLKELEESERHLLQQVYLAKDTSIKREKYRTVRMFNDVQKKKKFPVYQIKVRKVPEYPLDERLELLMARCLDTSIGRCKTDELQVIKAYFIDGLNLKTTSIKTGYHKQTIGTLLKKFKSDLEKIDLSNLSGGTYFINDLEWYHRYHYEICVLERQLLRGNEFEKSKLDRIQELKNRINLIKRIVQLDSDKLIREIMHFKYIENYSLDDVAILLGYSKSTVKKFHAFATSKLKIENDEMYNLFYSNYSEEERLKDKFKGCEIDD